MKIQTLMNTSKVLIVPMLVLFSTAAMAGPYGFDLHTVLAPKAAGMAGTSLAGDSGGPVEAIYGNPANLTDFQAGPGNENGANFTFGATFYYPLAKIRNDAGDPDNVADALSNGVRGAGSSYNIKSQAEYYTVPQIGVTQDLAGVGLPIVLGLGLSAVSGIGVDYRADDTTNGLGAELISLGVNVGAGYEVNDKLDLGAALTYTYSTLEAGFAGTNAQGHDYGLRLTFGADYHLTDHTDLAFQYQSELRHKFDDAVLVSNSDDEINIALANEFRTATSDGAWDAVDATYQTLSMEQPENFAFGISHKFNDHFRVMSDVIFKEWSDADFWGRFYHDQTAFSIGAEMDRGPITWRAGYGYANDPTRDTPEATALEGHRWACTGSPGHIGACFPLTTALGEQTWRYLQATETPVIYEHRITAGMTWDGFLAPFLSLDAHIAHQLHRDEDYDYEGTGSLRTGTDVDTLGLYDPDNDSDNLTTASVRSYHAGFALNWKF